MTKFLDIDLTWKCSYFPSGVTAIYVTGPQSEGKTLKARHTTEVATQL